MRKNITSVFIVFLFLVGCANLQTQDRYTALEQAFIPMQQEIKRVAQNENIPVEDRLELLEIHATINDFFDDPNTLFTVSELERLNQNILRLGGLLNEYQ